MTWNGKRTNEVITPRILAGHAMENMAHELTDSEKPRLQIFVSENMSRRVLELENKSTVFSDIEFGGDTGQSELASHFNYKKSNIGREFCGILKDSAEVRCQKNGIRTELGRMSHLAATIVTFSKIMARHLAEMNFCRLIGGHMGSTEDEHDEADIWTKNDKSVQILTSRAESPKTRNEKIDNPEKVDYYVVIHYKNDGSAKIGVQKVPNSKELVAKHKRAHLTASE